MASWRVHVPSDLVLNFRFFILQQCIWILQIYEPQSTWISIFLDFGDYKVLDFLQMTLQSYRIIQVGDYKDFLKILVQILCGLRYIIQTSY